MRGEKKMTEKGIPVVILAGGQGTRLSEETVVKPKPQVEIGGRPILWHIMKIYSFYGFNEFIIALGYRGEMIKEYFLHYRELNADFTINLADGATTYQQAPEENWIVHLVDTGLKTETGGRVKRLASFLRKGTFMLTYGDGLSDVNIRAVLEFHRQQKCLGTVTAVRPPARFGDIVLEESRVKVFSEKPQTGEGWINGGFAVFEPGVLEMIEGDQSSFERSVLERLAAEGQLSAYCHRGFWQCMDTRRDLRLLENLWQSENPPWRVWKIVV